MRFDNSEEKAFLIGTIGLWVSRVVLVIGAVALAYKGDHPAAGTCAGAVIASFFFFE